MPTWSEILTELKLFIFNIIENITLFILYLRIHIRGNLSYLTGITPV